ncbi:MAG: phosphoribosylaminoimidazolecarboxamide formyltransferase [Clostridiales bacterium]|nr:phosphoribosylaminoimidazolecarboxamide formyltransferase [Clostridiales bacterium]
MKELTLKYGCNPHQQPAYISMADGSELPFEVLNGRPGYINLLDALNGWQLVRELSLALGKPAAASFKHTSPTSAAIGLPLSERLKKACFVEEIKGLDDSPLACAYARARGTDRLSSFGDWISLSDTCDEATARLIVREVSDGVIAPGYTPKALSLLCEKKKGGYTVLRIDREYMSSQTENRQVFGVTFTQRRNDRVITRADLANIVTQNKSLPDDAARDLLVSLIVLKYTQSNSVAYAFDGQAIGVGAGQQSRVHCTRLAGDKADLWFLRQTDEVLALPFLPSLSRSERDNVIEGYINRHEEDVLADGVWQKYFASRPAPFTEEAKRAYLDSLSGVSLGSDAFFPFDDSIIRAHNSGVSYVAQPGGSIRDDVVIQRCDAYNMVMALTGLRLFHH